MLAGERPTLPMAWAELEAKARESLDERAIAYIFGGAGSEDTMRANLEAFRRWRIVPRVLRAGPLDARPLAGAARHRDARAGDAGADRRADPASRGGRARLGPSGRGGSGCR